MINPAKAWLPAFLIGFLIAGLPAGLSAQDKEFEEANQIMQDMNGSFSALSDVFFKCLSEPFILIIGSMSKFQSKISLARLWVLCGTGPACKMREV
jgi:hypothetical protein